jgi:hypothetical protein
MVKKKGDKPDIKVLLPVILDKDEDEYPKEKAVAVVKLLPLPQPSLPACTDARTHGHIQAPREPPNYGVCSRACTLSQDRTKLLLLSHKFCNVMINSTSLNEVH